MLRSRICDTAILCFPLAVVHLGVLLQPVVLAQVALLLLSPGQGSVLLGLGVSVGLCPRVFLAAL